MKKSLIALSIGSCLFANTALADIYFNGFASIVAGTTTASDETLYGYTDTVDFKKDSLFALQATGDVGEGLSVTAQILSRGNDDWSPKFEWAYIAYEATDNLRLLAGRQRAPFYMYSDFLDVSYAYAWITPPKGVYDLVFDTFDGVAAIYSTSFGSFDTTLHVVYGSNTDQIDAKDNLFEEDLQPTFDDIYGASFTVTRDWLTLRAAYFQTNTTLVSPSISALTNGWKYAGFNNIANNVEISNEKTTFAEFGFQIEYSGYSLIGEYTKLSIDNVPLADEQSYFIMAGKQLGSVQVQLTYGADEDTRQSLTTGVPVGVDPGLDALIAGTNKLVATQNVDASYVTLGLRWDFHDSAAFKLEFTDYSDDLNANKDASLVRAAIVTVF